MAVDTSFLAAFANQPLSLAILGLLALFGLWIWKGMPKIILKTHEKLGGQIDLMQKNHETMQVDIKYLKDSDAIQTSAIVGLQIDSLKGLLINDCIPLSERYWAFFRYVDLGGNGAVKDFVLTDLCKRDAELFESIKKLYYDKKKMR
jgi:hypothetical protein